MEKTRIKIVASAQITDHAIQAAEEIMVNILGIDQIAFVKESPDFVYFLSGGSERAAIENIHPKKSVLLLATERDNSHASAIEVKAYLGKKGISSGIVDMDDDSTAEKLIAFSKARKGVEGLKGTRLGLVGEVSDWLIASTPETESLQKVLGIELVHIPWQTLGVFSDYPISPEFLEIFQQYDKQELEKASQVYQQLKTCVTDNNLDALTVECFSLVTTHAVSGCLALAKFNNDGTPAGCEGDITSASGMMLLKEVLGTVPWMANVVSIKSDTVLLAHCTIAPNMVQPFSIITHFETGLGTAVQGELKGNLVTIFRLNDGLDKAFLAKADIIAKPRYGHACRTQIEIKLNEKDTEAMKQNPLGNHHLVILGDKLTEIRMLCQILDIPIIN